MNALRMILCSSNVAMAIYRAWGILKVGSYAPGIAALFSVYCLPAPILASLALRAKPTQWAREGAIGFNAILVLILGAGWLASNSSHRPYPLLYTLLLCTVNLLYFIYQYKKQRGSLSDEKRERLLTQQESRGGMVTLVSLVSVILPIVGFLISLSMLHNSGPADIGLGLFATGLIIVLSILGLLASAFAIKLSPADCPVAKSTLWLNLAYLLGMLAIVFKTVLFGH